MEISKDVILDYYELSYETLGLIIMLEKINGNK